MNDKELEKLSSLIDQDYLKDLFDKFSLILEYLRPRIIYRKIRVKKRIIKKRMIVYNRLIKSIFPQCLVLNLMKKTIKQLKK